MTMHLEKPYITTTKYHRKKKTNKNKNLLKAQSEHEKWLQKMGIDDASLDKKLPKDAKGRRLGVAELPNYHENERVGASTSKAAGNGTAKERNTYTGTLIKGIATMHKSNAVPVLNKQDAIDITNMRRN